MKILTIYILSITTLYAADFNKFFPVLLGFEGSAFTSFHYDNDGGGTKYGVTLHTYRAASKSKMYRWNFDKDGNGRITANDLRRATLYEIETIYKRSYWNIWLADRINNQCVAGCLVDFLVNSGPGYKGRHIKTIKARFLEVEPKTKVDTTDISIINKLDSVAFINNVSLYRISFLKRLRQWKFASKSWKRRTKYFQTCINLTQTQKQ